MPQTKYVYIYIYIYICVCVCVCVCVCETSTYFLYISMILKTNIPSLCTELLNNLQEMSKDNKRKL